MRLAERLQAAIEKLHEVRNWVHGPVPPLTRWFDQEGIQGWDGMIVLGDSAEEGDDCNPLARVYTIEQAEALLTLSRTIDAQIILLKIALNEFELGHDRGIIYELRLADAILGGEK